MGDEESKVLEINWDFHDGDDDPDWVYLSSEAAFAHKEACEFIVHVGDDKGDTFYRGKLWEMREAGCSRDLRLAYLKARRFGCRRVLFWS